MCKILDWEKLENYCLNCSRCELCRTRNKVVIDGGSRKADIMLVGEGPGAQEDMQGRVFIGPAGQLLDKMLGCIGLDRNQVYITNIVKCHPPHNRDPLPQEQQTCLPFLRAQFKLVEPEIIVCLGRVAAQAIIRPDFHITTEHGTWEERMGCWFTATYHPSALLRNASKKRDAYEDLKAIRRKLDALKAE